MSKIELRTCHEVMRLTCIRSRTHDLAPHPQRCVSSPHTHWRRRHSLALQ